MNNIHFLHAFCTYRIPIFSKQLFFFSVTYEEFPSVKQDIASLKKQVRKQQDKFSAVPKAPPAAAVILPAQTRAASNASAATTADATATQHDEDQVRQHQRSRSCGSQDRLSPENCQSKVRMVVGQGLDKNRLNLICTWFMNYVHEIVHELHS